MTRLQRRVDAIISKMEGKVRVRANALGDYIGFPDLLAIQLGVLAEHVAALELDIEDLMEKSDD